MYDPEREEERLQRDLTEKNMRLKIHGRGNGRTHPRRPYRFSRRVSKRVPDKDLVRLYGSANIIDNQPDPR